MPLSIPTRRALAAAVLLCVSLTATAQEADAVWANYDFGPGDTVLSYHEFEGTRVGNF